jgi:hypothetical protein
MIMSKVNLLRILLLSTGGLFLILSYLCFLYIIPGFGICGSACEYWWSWLIDFPPEGICITLCIPRNALYKPFFVIGLISIGLEILLEIVTLRQRRSKRD